MNSEPIRLERDGDQLLADLLERLPDDARPRGIAGALILCDNRLRAQIHELREAMNTLEARIADVEAQLIRERVG